MPQRKCVGLVFSPAPRGRKLQTILYRLHLLYRPKPYEIKPNAANRPFSDAKSRHQHDRQSEQLVFAGNIYTAAVFFGGISDVHKPEAVFGAVGLCRFGKLTVRGDAVACAGVRDRYHKRVFLFQRVDRYSPFALWAFLGGFDSVIQCVIEYNAHVESARGKAVWIVEIALKRDTAAFGFALFFGEDNVGHGVAAVHTFVAADTLARLRKIALKCLVLAPRVQAFEDCEMIAHIVAYSADVAVQALRTADVVADIVGLHRKHSGLLLAALSGFDLLVEINDRDQCRVRNEVENERNEVVGADVDLARVDAVEVEQQPVVEHSRHARQHQQKRLFYGHFFVFADIDLVENRYQQEHYSRHYAALDSIVNDVRCDLFFGLEHERVNDEPARPAVDFQPYRSADSGGEPANREERECEKQLLRVVTPVEQGEYRKRSNDSRAVGYHIVELLRQEEHHKHYRRIRRAREIPRETALRERAEELHQPDGIHQKRNNHRQRQADVRVKFKIIVHFSPPILYSADTP